MLDSRIEVLSTHHNGRGYHTATYAIDVSTYDEACELCKTMVTLPVESAYVSRDQMSDGRWLCRYSMDSGD